VLPETAQMARTMLLTLLAATARTPQKSG